MSARRGFLTHCSRALVVVGVVLHALTAHAAQVASVPPRSAAAQLNALSLCAGDCNGDEVVTVDELLAAGNITLGRTSVATCPASDANHDGRVTIDEVLTAANNALTGCPGASAAAWITHGPPGGGAVLTLVVDPSEPHILYAGGDGGVCKSTGGGDSWTPINSGLLTNTIAVDLLLIDPTAPETLYAAVGTNGPGYPSTFVAAQGIFKSTDNGGSWTFGNFRQQTNPSYVASLALALDPATPRPRCTWVRWTACSRAPTGAALGCRRATACRASRCWH